MTRRSGCAAFERNTAKLTQASKTTNAISVAEPELLGFGGEFVGHGLACDVVDALERDEVRDKHAPMSADHAMRDLFPSSRRRTRYGRETFKTSAASWVVSSA
jgi:hypothetical protein